MITRSKEQKQGAGHDRAGNDNTNLFINANNSSTSSTLQPIPFSCIASTNSFGGDVLNFASSDAGKIRGGLGGGGGRKGVINAFGSAASPSISARLQSTTFDSFPPKPPASGGFSYHQYTASGGGAFSFASGKTDPNERYAATNDATTSSPALRDRLRSRRRASAAAAVHASHDGFTTSAQGRDGNAFVGKTDPNERGATPSLVEEFTSSGFAFYNGSATSNATNASTFGQGSITVAPIAAWTVPTRQSQLQVDADFKYALEQQEQEPKDAKKRKQALEEQERKAMTSSNTGKAFLFVADLLKQIEQFNKQYPESKISPLARDDMIPLLERFLSKQEELRVAGLSTEVCYGYHYTKEENLSRIQTDGLLTQHERASKKIKSNFNGALHGDGIYTSDRPDTHRGHPYGNIGLFVARLKGQISGESSTSTFVSGHVVVLRKSDQCVPLFKYSGEPEHVIRMCHQTLQPFFDSWFNKDANYRFDANARLNSAALTWNSYQPPAAPLTFGSTFSSQAQTAASNSSSYIHHLFGGFANNSGNAKPSAPTTSVPLFATGSTTPFGGRSAYDTIAASNAAGRGPTTSVPLFATSSTAPFGGGSAYDTIAAKNVAGRGPTTSVPLFAMGSTAPSGGVSAYDTIAAKNAAGQGWQPGGSFGASPSVSLSTSSLFGTFASSAIAPFGSAAGSANVVSLPANGDSYVGTSCVTTSATAISASRFKLLSATTSTAAAPGFAFSAQSSPAATISTAAFSGFGAPASYNSAVPAIIASRAFGFGAPSATIGGVGFGVPLAASSSLNGTDAIRTIRYNAPDQLNNDAKQNIVPSVSPVGSPSDVCVICLYSLASKPLGKSATCGHMFHHACILESLSHSSRCPLCQKNIGTPQGTMPSGSMTVSFDPSLTCSGHGPGTIQIVYSFSDGTQKSYHGNPGVSFNATSRLAYLPDNVQGRDLLKRLEYAFSHGLTFTVGTSLTSNAPNQITWASIHHKTDTSGGVHGYPDANFDANCNGELDVLGVPAASDL
ncbi:E3 ubiquitin-protein ligase dtx3l [Mayamaea pseudoterrestris]|nr:E3 ubiquitin-protein ligase dtx3l [Mayamaea pseudoterrestris]